MKPWIQILIGIGFVVWGGGALIYQMQPGVIGIKSIPILLLLAGLANLYIGIKRNKNPKRDARAKTQKEANEAALSLHTETSTQNISEETKKGSIYQFLLRSYERWKSGMFDGLSDYYKKTATKDSPEVLTGAMLNESSFHMFLERCFKVREPETDESLFTISPNNFMITNKCLYLSTSSKQGEIHIAPLCKIKSYSNKGLWMKSGILKLKNGKEIQFKLEAVPDEKRLRQLQELLNCEQLIDL